MIEPKRPKLLREPLTWRDYVKIPDDLKRMPKKYYWLLVPLFAGLLLAYAFSHSTDALANKVQALEQVDSAMAWIVLGIMIGLPIILYVLSAILFCRRMSPRAPKRILITKRRKAELKRRAKEAKRAEILRKKMLKLNGLTEEDLIEEEEEEEEEAVPRFFMLTQIDDRMRKKPKPAFDDTITLKSFCEDFRNFAASKLGLYYEATDIRQFIAGMSVSHILVMQGMSGTGKTSLAYAFGEYIQNKSTIVPIQPMWKERTDLIGYYNEFTKKFNETVLLQKMYEANYSDEMYITVLDEMNIARVEYYFAEFLSLLEIPNPEGRYLDVVSDKMDNDPRLLKDGRLKLPVNMWFIGTANNDDSTFAISDKVYDRAMVMNLDKKSKWFDAPSTGNRRISMRKWDELVRKAIGEYKMTERNKKRIRKLDEYMIDNFHITFGNRIMKQMNQYIPVMIACGGNEVEAIDDILAKKVLRKLEAQNPIYVRNSAEGLKAYLDELFGQDKMPRCKAYLTHLERNA